MLVKKNIKTIFAPALMLETINTLSDSVAQPVEQYTFNVWVLGSNPSRITLIKALSKGWCFFSLRSVLAP
jgi:hypothetical protein